MGTFESWWYSLPEATASVRLWDVGTTLASLISRSVFAAVPWGQLGLWTRVSGPRGLIAPLRSQPRFREPFRPVLAPTAHVCVMGPSLAVHAALFGWTITIAFPWLGEWFQPGRTWRPTKLPPCSIPSLGGASFLSGDEQRRTTPVRPHQPEREACRKRAEARA